MKYKIPTITDNTLLVQIFDWSITVINRT